MEQDIAEETMIRLNDGVHITLKQTRDVIMALKTGERLAILGIVNQFLIDYIMPFRVMSSDYIIMARYISEIEKRHKEERKHNGGEKLTGDEFIGGFYYGGYPAQVFEDQIYITWLTDGFVDLMRA